MLCPLDYAKYLSQYDLFATENGGLLKRFVHQISESPSQGSTSTILFLGG
jgi:hypothetical protein